MGKLTGCLKRVGRGEFVLINYTKVCYPGYLKWVGRVVVQTDYSKICDPG